MMIFDRLLVAAGHEVPEVVPADCGGGGVYKDDWRGVPGGCADLAIEIEQHME